ncbi:hypothetical protein [Longitalea arenae]|uniref:hypothetical protein n=1 Tax=Longitalea arenae TaxID=2812558 RepID=UPI001967C003|nr:hypothetical protein [Longitalea arenae]
MEFKQAGKQILPYVISLILTSCTNDQSSDLKEAGKNYYDKACLTCHLTGDNTLHQPSLERMSKYDRRDLLKIFNKLRKEDYHSQILPNDYKIDSLLSYIKSYKKYDAIPQTGN